MTDAARKELKNDICSYFIGAGIAREMLPKILKAIKSDSADGCPFDILKNFHANHHAIVKSFVSRLYEIENAWMEVEEEEESDYARLESAEKDLHEALPLGCRITEKALRNASIEIAEGKSTVQQAVLKLTSKKVLTLRK